MMLVDAVGFTRRLALPRVETRHPAAFASKRFSRFSIPEARGDNYGVPFGGLPRNDTFIK